MTSRAAIAAQLVDIRNVGLHKSVKLTLHVPAEQAEQVMRAFGWPTMTDPVPVALARLDTQSGARAPAREAGEDRRDSDLPASRSSRVAPDKRLAQRAGILCNDPVFRKYLAELSGLDNVTADEAAAYIRAACHVESRADILPGTPAAAELDNLYSKFIAWRDAPDYAVEREREHA